MLIYSIDTHCSAFVFFPPHDSKDVLNLQGKKKKKKKNFFNNNIKFAVYGKDQLKKLIENMDCGYHNYMDEMLQILNEIECR